MWFKKRLRVEAINQFSKHLLGTCYIPTIAIGAEKSQSVKAFFTQGTTESVRRWTHTQIPKYNVIGIVIGARTKCCGSAIINSD